MSRPCASGVNAMQPIAFLAERVEQVLLDPAIEHVVRGLVDQERDVYSRSSAAASRVFAAEYDEMPT